jgi:hypothetical protein
MSIEDEYKKHMAPTVAEGYVLDPPGYERLRDWTFLLFQINYTANELRFLTEKKPELYNANNFHEHLSRFCAAVVRYGRCFGQSGPGMVSLNAREVFKARSDLKPVHDRMIEIWNDVFAHTGHDELMRATLAVREEPDNKRISIKHLFTPVLPYRDFLKYSEVVKHVEQDAILKINKYIAHLERQLGKEIVVT